MRIFLLSILFIGSVFAEAFEDAAVYRGVLENGLTYFVRENKNPEQQALVQLVVKVGSAYEREDELGYAHLVEHMVYRGSDHFKDGEVVRFFDALGAWEDADTNGETSFASTKYSFAIPVDTKDSLEKTVLVLSDFAARCHFNETSLQKEKGVVLDEFHRSNSHAESQASLNMLQEFVPSTPFATRLPIGTAKSIKNATAAGLKNFYQRWYTPDRMAVIVVGDVEAGRVIAMIKEMFGSIPSHQGKSIEPVLDIQLPSASKAAMYIDSELTDNALNIFSFSENDSVTDIEAIFYTQLVMALANNRFNDVSAQNGDCFYSINLISENLGFDVSLGGIFADITEKPRQAAQILSRELKKIKSSGFTKTELTKVKAQLEKQWLKQLDNLDTIEHEDYSDIAEEHFLFKSPLYDLDHVLNYFLTALEHATVDEVNEHLFASSNDTIAIYYTSSTSPHDLSETDLLNIFDMNSSISGEISSAENEKRYEIATWKLSNGISVALKPTKLEKKQVMIHALALGGISSTETPEECMTARILIPYLQNSGIGPFSINYLNQLRETEELYFRASLDDDTRSLFTSGHKHDVETMFEIIHAFFASPSFNPIVWDGVNQVISMLSGKALNEPDAQFNAYLEKIYSNDNFHLRNFDPTLTNEELVKPLYNRFFGAPKSFHFSIIGDFTYEEIEPLVKKYLGTLPSREQELLFSSSIIEFPKEELRFDFVCGNSTNTTTILGYTYCAKEILTHAKENFTFSIMNKLLESRLKYSLREDAGHTYHVSVGPLGPKDTCERNAVLQISFTAQEEHRQELIQKTVEAIEELKKSEITEEELAMAKQSLLQTYKKMQRSNAYWSLMLNNSKIYSKPYDTVLDFNSNISLITIADMKGMIHKVFNGAFPIIATLLPEKSD